MANANEFVSRLSLINPSQISHEILLHLKQTFGFDHVILPEFSNVAFLCFLLQCMFLSIYAT